MEHGRGGWNVFLANSLLVLVKQRKWRCVPKMSTKNRMFGERTRKFGGSLGSLDGDSRTCGDDGWFGSLKLGL